MLNSSSLLRSNMSHLFVTLLFLTIITYIQSFFISRFYSQWFHIDLVSIAIIYVCVEDLLYTALVKVLFIGYLMQILSSAPDGFFLLYFLILLVLAKSFSRIFILDKLSGQFLIFMTLFLIKYLLLFFVFVVKNSYSSILLISVCWREIFVTTLIALPMFKLFLLLDSFFEFLPSFERRRTYGS